MSDLSVLTLVRDRSVNLNRLIEGLNRSTLQPLELVIVDMSAVALRPMASNGFATTIVRLMTDGLPLAAAPNLAARHSKGERLLFVDVDCLPTGDLAGRIDAALQAQNTAICAEVLYLAANAVGNNWSEAGLDTIAEPHPVRNFPRSGQRVETNAGLF